MLEFPEDIGEKLAKWIPEHPICIINLASQPETTIRQYQSDFKYIVRYLSCGNDRRYRKAKELIEETEGKGGKINMCVLLDMYEERGIEKGIVQGEARGMAKGISQINTLYYCLLADNRMEDIQKAIMDTEYQKELLREYGIRE